jgi:hypothetical protein
MFLYQIAVSESLSQNGKLSSLPVADDCQYNNQRTFLNSVGRPVPCDLLLFLISRRLDSLRVIHHLVAFVSFFLNIQAFVGLEVSREFETTSGQQ